jgi:hypothetical protein
VVIKNTKQEWYELRVGNLTEQTDNDVDGAAKTTINSAIMGQRIAALIE